MLWYKAWLETRARFFIAGLLCVFLCVQMVFVSRTLDPSLMGSLAQLQGVHTLLVFAWIMGTTLLLMGGLVREKALGSSSFTLSLPVSRLHLVLVRIGMGLLQGFALALVPWIAMLLASHPARKWSAVWLAVSDIYLLLGGGVVFLAISLVISSIVEGEYTAPVVGFGLIVIFIYAFSFKPLLPYSPWAYMVGLTHFHRNSAFPLSPVPWLAGVGFLAVASFLTLVAVKIIESKDF